MKTPEQLKQWVRSGGKKCVIIRQRSTTDQEEFMRDSPSKRGFDRLYNMLMLCDSIKEIEKVERIIGRSVMTSAISIHHARAVSSIAMQRKLQLKELRTIKGWWRCADDQERFAASLIAVALAYFILFVIR